MSCHVVRTSGLVALLAAALLSAADFDQNADGEGNGNPRLRLTVSPDQRTVSPGGSTSFDIGVKGVGNFNGTATLSAVGLPAGVAASFSPGTLNLKNGKESDANAWLTVAANTPPGRYPVTFTVNGGSVSDAATAVLVVSSGATGGGFDFNTTPDERTVGRGGETTFGLSLSMAGVGTSTVNLSLKSAPNGISATFAPSSTVILSGNQIAVATANVFINGSVQPGNYQLVFAADTATTHRERAILLHVVGGGVGELSFDVSPEFRALIPSSTLPFTLVLASRNGLQGTVNLTATGLPPGATVAFQPGSSVLLAPGGTAVVTAFITTGPQALAGNFPVRFSADVGTVHREEVAVLGTMDDSGFEFNVVPGEERIAPGGIAKFALLLTPRFGFSGPVKVAALNLPPGAIATFDPSDVVQLSSGKTSVVTLQVQTAGNTLSGEYPLNISADGGSFSRHRQAILKVSSPDVFTFSASPITRTVPPGGAASYELSLGSVNQFAGSVDLSAADLPPGVSLLFTPDSTAVLTPGGNAKVLATLTTSGSTPIGTYVVVFKAKSGGVERQAMVRLGVAGNASFNFTATPLLRITPPSFVTSFAFTLTSLNNFSGPVSITTSGLPNGVAVVFTPGSPITLQAGQSISILAQVTVGASAAVGKYPIRFTASSVNAASDALVMLWVTTDQGYFLEVSPNLRDVAPGNSASYTVRLTSIGSFSGPVQLFVQGLPPFAGVGFEGSLPVNLAGGQSLTIHATVATSTNTPLGAANLKFNADSGAVHKEDTVVLNVVPDGGFKLNLDPSSKTVASGGIAYYAVTVSSVGGFAGAVNLTVLDLPAGFVASLNPGSPLQLMAGEVEVVQLGITTPANAGEGPYPFRINAAAAGQQIIASGRVVVDNVDALNLSIAPAVRSVLRGQTAEYTVRVASQGYRGPVLLTTAGLPPGAVALNPSNQLMIQPGESIDVRLLVTPGASASSGPYDFAIVAATNLKGVTEATARLLVSDSQTGADISLVIMPAARTVNSGATAVYKVLVSSLNGFRGSVNLAVAGFPAGDIKWESGDSVFLAEGQTKSVTLLIKTEKGAEEDLYLLTFVADSETIHREATGSVTVVKTRNDDDDDDDEEEDEQN